MTKIGRSYPQSYPQQLRIALPSRSYADNLSVLCLQNLGPTPTFFIGPTPTQPRSYAYACDPQTPALIGFSDPVTV